MLGYNGTCEKVNENMRFKNRSIEIGDYLCIADLHIGFEKALEEEGFNVPSQTVNIFDEITKNKDSCKHLIINGDIKHNIPNILWQEYREVPHLIAGLRKQFETITLIKGNHDGRIEKLIDIDVKREILIDDIGIIHGHRYPSDKLTKKAKTIVMAHTHPVFSYTDHLGINRRLPCWIIGAPKASFRKRFGSTVERIVVMPAFNSFFVGTDTEYFGVLNNLVKVTDIMLLDMTKVV